MYPKGSMFLFILFDKRWFQSSIVSGTQSNAGASGRSKSQAVSMTESVAEVAGEGRNGTPLRNHIPSVAEMRRVFQQFDGNKDGVICSSELSGFMEKVGFKLSTEEVQSLVKTVDQNSDGELDFDEFYALFESLTAGDSKHSIESDTAQEKDYEENLKQAFRVFDKDNDGSITALELQSTLLSLGMQEGKSLIHCQQMIRRVDADGDGRVSFQEFKKLMSSDALQS